METRIHSKNSIKHFKYKAMVVIGLLGLLMLIYKQAKIEIAALVHITNQDSH